MQRKPYNQTPPYEQALDDSGKEKLPSNRKSPQAQGGAVGVDEHSKHFICFFHSFLLTHTSFLHLCVSCLKVLSHRMPR